MRLIDTVACHGENAVVMTRNVRILFWCLPRTKFFSLADPSRWGILWWRPHRMADLIDLHQHCLEMVRAAGLTEVSAQCHRQDAEACAYWEGKLGPHFRHLKKRT